jgi:hypothetical protein
MRCRPRLRGRVVDQISRYRVHSNFYDPIAGSCRRFAVPQPLPLAPLSVASRRKWSKKTEPHGQGIGEPIEMSLRYRMTICSSKHAGTLYQSMRSISDQVIKIVLSRDHCFMPQAVNLLPWFALKLALTFARVALEASNEAQ